MKMKAATPPAAMSGAGFAAAGGEGVGVGMGVWVGAGEALNSSAMFLRSGELRLGKGKVRVAARRPLRMKVTGSLM